MLLLLKDGDVKWLVASGLLWKERGGFTIEGFEFFQVIL